MPAQAARPGAAPQDGAAPGPYERMLEREYAIAAEVSARTEAWQRPPVEYLPPGHASTALCPHCNDCWAVPYRTTGDAFWPLGLRGEPSATCKRCEPKLSEQLDEWRAKFDACTKAQAQGVILIAGIRDLHGPVPEYCVMSRDGDHITVRRLGWVDFPEFHIHIRDAYPQRLGIHGAH